ncbi:hypothetical protein NPIL_202321 [Nephila pilipes]|uniref:Uncharacterized protein n=1 Tax=Nephila pilipes TaxID=299642 RepID=A0A8X6UFZ2_NEPPI|nr:hypothetical protein NPIL_202321 [Nephila pilipes]
MANYTNAELADMHSVYGVADCSRPATQRFHISVREVSSRGFPFQRLGNSQRKRNISYQVQCAQKASRGGKLFIEYGVANHAERVKIAKNACRLFLQKRRKAHVSSSLNPSTVDYWSVCP